MFTYSVEEFMLVEYQYRAGKLSQEEAIKELNKKWKSGLRFFRRKMKKIMEKHEFYRFLPGGINELIDIHDKIINSVSESERKKIEGIYQNIINAYLKEIRTKSAGKQTIGALDIDRAKAAIYMERDEIANLCQEERIISTYYKDYVAKIVKATEPLQQINKHELPILKELVDAGQLKYENGNYLPYKTMPEFIAWCSENNYMDNGDKVNKYKDDLPPSFVFENIKHTCTIETIKRYFRDVKNPRIGKKSKNG